MQALSQVSSSRVLASSQSSPGPSRPSPHTLARQSGLQAAAMALAGPSSHSSPGSSTALPQIAGSPVGSEEEVLAAEEDAASVASGPSVKHDRSAQGSSATRTRESDTRPSGYHPGRMC